ncbi:hypothetical protein IPJ72_03200 [Candidatus Peregrinibacteria bacterium]|nr:MAG: hypothetical protein IPJ72_03200 [Candidatus Peregrinibacteria bacterium]
MIIDESIFTDPTKAESLVSRVSHELRHWVFEGNPELKSLWMDAYTKNAQWPRIKQLFVDAYPTKQPPRDCEVKESYSASDWKDEDVLSELYAMEVGMDPEKPLSALSKAVVEAGIPAKVMGIEQLAIIRGQEDDAAKGIASVSPSLGTDQSADPPKTPDELMGEINKTNEKIDELLNSKLIGNIPGGKGLLSTMKSYNKDGEVLVKEYEVSKDTQIVGVLDNRQKLLKEDLEKIKMVIEKIQEAQGNTEMSPLRSIWNNTTFVSVGDIWQTMLDLKEFLERRHKRKQADHAARIGTALTENVPLLGDFGTESAARQEKAEADEVGEWKGRLENKDAWALYGILDKMANNIAPNKDQFKAILRILADKGRIDWRNKSIWTIFNKLQSAAYLSQKNDGRLSSDSTYLDAKLRAAAGGIWDYEEYSSLKRTNENSYNSKKGDYTNDIEKTPDKIPHRLAKLLREYREGGKVEAAEYEALIEYAINNAKFYAEGATFYLIAGIAAGLLTHERALALNKYSNQFPIMDWFPNNGIRSQQDYADLCLSEFAEEYNSGSISSGRSSFKNYYITVMHSNQAVMQRTRKSVIDRKWDHDWARSIVAGGDADTVRKWLSGRSGEVSTHATGVENLYAGMLQAFEEGAITQRPNWREHFDRQIGNLMMAEGAMNKVYRRSDEKIFRDPGIYGKVPLEASVRFHGDWTVVKHRDKMVGFISGNQDLKTLYQMITNGNEVAKESKAAAPEYTDKIKKHLKSTGVSETIVDNIQGIDDVFLFLEPIVKSYTSKMSDDEYRKMILSLATGI